MGKIEIRDEDVIALEYLQKYRDERAVIANQLVYIQNCLLIMDEIAGFPFDVLAIPDGDRHFWKFASRAMYESVILTFWRLIHDPNDFLISRFKNRLIRTYKRSDISQDIHNQLMEDLKNVNFDRRIKELGKSIDIIRNNFIAHLDYDNLLKSDMQARVAYRMPLEELKTTLIITQQLFNVLCLGVHHSLVLWDYHPGIANPYAEDVRNILESVASQSYYLRDFSEDNWLFHARNENYAKLSESEKNIIDSWKQRTARFKSRD